MLYLHVQYITSSQAINYINIIKKTVYSGDWLVSWFWQRDHNNMLFINVNR